MPKRPATTEKLLDYQHMAGVPTNVVMPVPYRDMLKFLSEKSRIRQSEYLREALQDLLIKYRHEFKGSPFEF